MFPRVKSLFLITCVIFLTSIAVAQDQQTVDQIFRIKPVQGHELQFEEAYKQHIGWHKQQNDSWRWDCWEYVAGPNTGQYIVATTGHKWSDFERGEMGKADKQHARETVTTHVERMYSYFSTSIPSLTSNIPDEPAPLLNAVVYYIKPGHGRTFRSALNKLHAGLQKDGWDRPYMWKEPVAGAERAPMYYVISPRQSWGDFAPPEKSLLEALDDALGRMESEEIRRLFWSSVDSVESHVLAYRPDLSYAP